MTPLQINFKCSKIIQQTMDKTYHISFDSCSHHVHKSCSINVFKCPLCQLESGIVIPLQSKTTNFKQFKEF